MAIREIRLMGDPILYRKADSVTHFDKELRNLVQDLTDTMLDAPGAGLAAPQLGVSLRVFTYIESNDEGPGYLINPELELSGEMVEDDEGCLSIPGFVWKTKRKKYVVAKGFDMYGEPVEIEGSDFLARIIQHETDHLDGMLFLDRLDPDERKKAMKEIRESDWFSGQKIKISPHKTFGRQT